eukprot:gene11939-14612_t
MRQLQYLLLFTFILSISFFTIPINGAFNEGVVVNEKNNFLVQWELNDDTISFQVSANINTWIAIGWHCSGCSSDGAMQNADYVIANYSNGQVTVQDYVSSPGQYGSPPILDTTANGTYDLLSVGGFQTTDYSYFAFTRKLVTGDVNGDRDIVLPNLDLIWAHGTSNTFDFHGVGNAGRLTINLSSGHTHTGPDYVSWHAVFMCVAFAFCMPMGAFAAKYLKAFHWWFPLHIILQTSALILAIVAFILVLVMNKGLDFSTYHAIMGFITICLAVVAYGLGVTSHLMWNPNRRKIPFFPDITHWLNGRLVIIFSVAPIVSGMVLHQVPNALIITYGGLMGFYTIVVIWLEVYRKVYPQYSNPEVTPLLN